MKRTLLLGISFAFLVSLSQEKHIPEGTALGEEEKHTQKVQLQKISADKFGLFNLMRISKQIYSGSEPHGEEAFRKLADLGVKTIVSVDGAKPQLEMAKKYGFRYVHIPIGYDGVSQLAGKMLARLIQEVDSPLYFHCHHGKHRGPAAAAVACIAGGFTDGEGGLQILEKAGTSRNYPGLWRDVKGYKPPPPGVKLPELVAVAKVSSLAAVMAIIDRKYDNLKLCEEAKWRTPKKHPDLVPNLEAVMLQQAFTESAKELSTNKTKQFKFWLVESANLAGKLNSALRAGNIQEATRYLKSLKQSCNRCHVQYRN